jgi:molecular chaperone GrpE
MKKDLGDDLKEEKDLINSENENNVRTEHNSDKIETENNESNDKKEIQEGSKNKSGFFGKKTTPKEDSQKDIIEKLKKENAKYAEDKQELNDKFLRLYSEFDNYKKRTNKEKLDLIDTASEKVLRDMLPIVDDFERAIHANQNLNDAEAIKSGFELIYSKFLQLLKVYEVSEIPAKGEFFNTDFHEAITHFPATEEDEKGKVMEVSQKGYKIKNKVIRYSKVVVGI